MKIVYHKHGKLSFEQPKQPVLLPPDERLEQSVCRTKSTVLELALCNPWDWFVTLTFDPGKTDRMNLDCLRVDFAHWVRNLNRSRDELHKLRYLLIPEQHKSLAWHMHGLIIGLTESELVVNENGYCDWLPYRNKYGFISISRVKSHVACSRYITKYITKDVCRQTQLDPHAHSYYASQGLQRRQPLVIRSCDPCPVGVDGWDFDGDYCKIAWLGAKSYFSDSNY